MKRDPSSKGIETSMMIFVAVFIRDGSHLLPKSLITFTHNNISAGCKTLLQM
jgi:hypothetical protein